jgi:hypothetical protein
MRAFRAGKCWLDSHWLGDVLALTGLIATGYIVFFIAGIMS